MTFILTFRALGGNDIALASLSNPILCFNLTVGFSEAYSGFCPGWGGVPKNVPEGQKSILG